MDISSKWEFKRPPLRGLLLSAALRDIRNLEKNAA